MNKILVTGGTGMVGKYLRDILPNAVYIGSKDYDLRNFKEVKDCFKTHKPDHVIHLGAKVGGILENISFPADFYNDNTLINTNVLIMAKQSNTKRFTAILSTCMYPDVVKKYPMTEDDIHLGPPSDANFSYGFTKRSLSVAIDAYNKQYNTKYNYVIPCNLYGEYDHFDDPNKCHFITALIRKIIDADNKGSNQINLFGTGKPLRQFMYAKDLARTIKLIIDKDITDSFNVATSEERSIEDMAKIALEVLNKDFTINFDTNKPDGQYRKMLENVGEFTFTSLKDGIKNVYDKIKKEYGK
jgi:GDP-L-fucose synthase